MNSIGFPKLFSRNTTIVKKDKEALKQNLSTLLNCECGEFKGDPYFGINLKRYMFDQNDTILRDILIDEIYTQLAAFMPQLVVDRKDISIVQRGTTVQAVIKAVNQLDYKTDMYNIRLFSEDNI